MSRRRPNYLTGVEILADQARLHGGGITHVGVTHEKGCAFWKGSPCDCEPDIRVLSTQRGQPGGDDGGALDE